MKRIVCFAAVVALALCCGSADAQSARPKIGLALSGGGAKGAAHVGVLRQLERMHIPVDYIAGTSMGAIVGVLYASGMTPDEIEKELSTIDWEEALSDATAFKYLTYRRKFEETRYPTTVEVGIKKGKLVVPAGIRTGQKLSFLLTRYLLPHLDETDFSKLPIPYAAVATNLETGDPYVITHGDLAEAVRASMSIPGAFTPVEWSDGTILVDGGVTMNVPVEVVRKMGADIVIAVDIAAALGGRENLNSTLGVLGQLSGFLTRKNMERQLAAADLVISPDIKGFETLDFSKVAEIVKRGDTEAAAREADLVKYAIPAAEHAALVNSRHVARERNFRIDDIRVEGLHFVDERFIRKQMETMPGETLDLEKLQRDVEWMYGWNDFTGIHAGIETKDGKNTLVIRVTEKPWGPAYVRTGIGVETRYNQPAVFLLLNYTRRWVNSRGAEWRNDLEFGNDWGLSTEFYQPRGYDKYGFVAGGGSYTRRGFRIYDGQVASNEYEIRQFELFTDVGVRLRTAGEARLGLFHRWNDAELEIGVQPQPQLHENSGGLRFQLNFNTTDEPFFPNNGERLSFRIQAPLEALGADGDNAVGDLRTTAFRSFGRHVFTAGLFAHDTFSGEALVFDAAVLGGLNNLSGVPLGSLIDQAAAVFSFGYRNRVTKIPGLSDGVYAGVLAEAGNVYSTLSDIDFPDLKKSVSLYLGIDTAYGPLIIAGSKAEDSPAQYYLQIGRSF